MARRSTYLMSAVAGAALLPTPLLAQAEASSDRALEEIVVTARKRTESLINVPVAVTAVSAQEIERTGVSDLNRIAQLAPQVMVARGDASGSGASFSIRGLGSTSFDGGVEQSVTVNIDGVQVTRGNIVSSGFFDLEQVEVLKGPQALFFGKNSPAGVISLRSKGPGDTLEGYVRAGYEFEARERYAEAAVSGPITSSLKARLAIRGSRMRGWMRNVAEPLPDNPFYPGVGSPGRRASGNGGEELVGRGTIVFDPGGNFDATLKVSAGSFKDNGTTQQAFCDPDTGAPASLGAPDPFLDCKVDKYYASTGIDPSLITDDWRAKGIRGGNPFTDQWSMLNSLTMNLKLGAVTLTSVTGYFKLHYRSFNNSDFTSYGAIQVALGEDTRTFSQELRAVSDFDGPINFTLGGYYEDVKRTDQIGALLFGSQFGPDPATGNYFTFGNRSRNRGDTLSAFGQLRWALMDTLELAGGVRYTREKKRIFFVNDYVHALSGPLLALMPAGIPLSDPTHYRDTDWSPEVTLTWKPGPQTMLYAAYKTGYKSGGFSRPALYQTFTSGDGLRFGAESSEGGEIGFKGYLADRTLRLEATAYRYTYSGLQVSTFNPDTFSYGIRNAASARIQGFELASQWRVLRELTINGSASYNRARFRNFEGAQCYVGQPTGNGPGLCSPGGQDLSGRALPRAPEWTFMLGASYDAPITEALALGLDADLNYSDSYVTQDDQNPVARQDSFALFNAAARLHGVDDRWELALIGRNLANKKYRMISASKAFGNPNDFQVVLPRTREVRLQATYRF